MSEIIEPMAPPPSERDDIETLLPWYVSGRLDAADRERVESWLARDASLERQLAHLDDDRRATLVANDAVRMPKSLNVEAGMAAALARRPATRSSAGWFGDAVASVRGFFEAPSPGAVRWAGAAAVAIIAIQSAIVLTLLPGAPTQPSYETASGQKGTMTEAGTFALLRFTDGATMKDVSSTLSGLGMTIVSGPKPGGLYHVKIGEAGMSAAARDAAIASLRARQEIVVFATPTP
ncbi:MAG: hypothetical protein SH859_16315 [Hyphomicrobium aestuarii]|nr:hypothetical protein [Hyphomicrobium aestuarii]